MGITLMKECWAHDTAMRPKFKGVVADLQDAAEAMNKRPKQDEAANVSAAPEPEEKAEAKPERPMMQILKDVKAAVKELTGEDVRNITEAVELLGLKNEGTPKEKVHAAAIELRISIFVE